MRWPPVDSFRNRFLWGLGTGVAALVAVYFLLFALASGAPVPWSIFTVALAATLVGAVALFLMLAARRGSTPPASSASSASPTAHGPRDGRGTGAARRRHRA